MDGGGWSININYNDETVKTSIGSNNSPTRIFKKADYAFYNLFGEDLFGTVPSSYKYPPAMDIAYDYSYDTTIVSDGTSLSSTNATWNKYKKDGINNIQYALQNQRYTFLEKYDYEFTLWTANYEFKFSNLEIKSYDLNGKDEKLIVSTNWFKQKEFELDFDSVYVITITYPQGVCEYAFATKLNITD